MGLDFAELFENITRVGASVGMQVVCAVIAALIYAYKGKSWAGGAALGFFMGPFGVFIALVTSGNTTAGKNKQVYAPETTNSIPQMRMVESPITPSSPKPVQYKLPSRCPSCNAPMHPQELHSPYTSCAYCGSQVEAITA